MKKIATLALVLSVAASSVFAQATPPAGTETTTTTTTTTAGAGAGVAGGLGAVGLAGGLLALGLLVAVLGGNGGDETSSSDSTPGSSTVSK